MKQNNLKAIVLILFLSSSTIALAQDDVIKVTFKRNQDNTVDFSYEKTAPGSYYIVLTFSDLINSETTKFDKVVQLSRGLLFKLRPLNPKQGIGFSYTVRYIRGNPKPKVDKSFNYVLPFKVGKSIIISETSNLKETYFDAEKDPNWKSFMTVRKSADTIYSMRKGIVVEIVNTYDTDTLDIYKYTSKMNRIVIEHDDGTYARYIGFKKNSIFVKLGQTVYPQTKLGALDLFNNSFYRFYFDMYYLKDVDLDSGRKQTMSSESNTEHINPYFYSSQGPIHLTHLHTYTVETDETTLIKEFTRREKKNYEKDKSFIDN